MTIDSFIYGGMRSPFGKYGGSLAPMRPDDLLASVVKSAIGRSGIPADAFEDLIAGCANQAGEDSRNVARHAALLAGLPMSIGAQTVNRLCGSGLAAVIDAARAVITGSGEALIAGGVESMSRAPFVMAKADAPYSRTLRTFDSTIGERFPNPVLQSAYGKDTMAETAENVAKELEISRADSDKFAIGSQMKYARALTTGFFNDEIVPIDVPVRRGQNASVASDEHPRSDTTLEKIGQLPPLQPTGIVTAANASGINDGAAAVIVGSLAIGHKHGQKPIAKLRAAAIAGVAPRLMGLGPVPASAKALERAGLTLQQMDVIELNEAFAPQVLGCLKSMGISFDDTRVNPNGGAIAIGHPLGASGARLALTAARQLKASRGKYALVTMCIGVGQGIAAVLEAV